MLTADGATVEAGTLLWDAAHVAAAFDLTIDEVHTYHVTAGDQSVLVHNTGAATWIELEDGVEEKYLTFWGDEVGSNVCSN